MVRNSAPPSAPAFDGSYDALHSLVKPALVGRMCDWPRWALTHGDGPALLFEPAGCGAAMLPLGQLTWSQLAVRVQRLARQLQSDGFAPGDRLVHACGNSYDGVLVALASMAVGVIEVPLDPLLDMSSREALARHVEGRWLRGFAADMEARADADSNPVLAANWLLEQHACRAFDEPALILFTSGTGGKSKAVTLSRRNLDSNAAAKLRAVPQSPNDVRVCLLPICHAYARTCDLGTWLLSGCSLAITSGWDGWQRVSPVARPTLVNTVPSVAMRLLSQWRTAEAGAPGQVPPELSRLQLLGCGGAALPAEAFAAFAQRGVVVIQGYGMTEASPVICSASPDSARPQRVGRPVDGWQTRVEADGRLWVRGDGVMLGYWNDPEETARRIVDGWLDTGDLVEVDPVDGQYRILGRVDDRITLPNARKVHPGPIEQRVLGLRGVLHALLVPNDRHLELWIDVQPELRQRDDWEQRVGDWLTDLPPWQRPRRVRVLVRALTEMPGTLTRKGSPIRAAVISQRESLLGPSETSLSERPVGPR